MPPHQYSSVLDEAEISEVDIENETSKENQKQFSQYCRIFFTHSLALKQKKTSVTDKNDIECGDVGSSRSMIEIETSAAVMNAFQKICSTRGMKMISCENETHNLAIARCGLLDPSFLCDEKGNERISHYSKIRDTERMNAHKNLMISRKDHFLVLLKEKESELNEVNKEEIELQANKNVFLALLAQWTSDTNFSNSVREFSGKYKTRLGVHAFLAGLRKIFETQLEKKNIVVCWSFDIACLTENCTGDDELMLDALNILSILFNRDYSDENGNGTEKNDSKTFLIKWRIKNNISFKLMKRILKCLPRLNDLDAKPTGTIIQSKEAWIVSSQESRETTDFCIENFCVVS